MDARKLKETQAELVLRSEELREAVWALCDKKVGLRAEAVWVLCDKMAGLRSGAVHMGQCGRCEAGAGAAGMAGAVWAQVARSSCRAEVRKDI